MSSFNLNFRFPVACFDLRYVLSTPRKPSAFEAMIVYLVNYCQTEKKYLSDTVPNVFKSILQVNDVEIFIEPAIEELFSASIDVFRTGNYNVPRPECPIRDIEITDVGRRLLREEKLPSAPHRRRQKLFYNFITGMLEAKGDSLDEYDFNRIGGVKTDTYVNVFPESVLSQELWRLAGEKDAEVTELEQISPVTFRQKYSMLRVNVADGKISCISNNSKIQDFLDGLDADAFRDTVLTEPTAWEDRLSTPTINLDEISPLELCLPKDLANTAGRKVPITLHTPDCKLNNIIPETLEIIATDDDEGKLDTTSTPARLIMPLDWRVENNGISDLSSVYEIANVRLFYKGEPLVVPMGVRLGLPSDFAATICRQIISVLLEQNGGLPFAWIAAGNDASLQKLVLARLKQMPDIAEGLRMLRDVKKVNLAMLLAQVFPSSGLKDFVSIQNAYSVVMNCGFHETHTAAFLKQLEVCAEALPTPTIDDWMAKWSLLKRLRNRPPEAKDLAALVKFIPLVPDQGLKDNAAHVRTALSEIGLSKSYAEICRELLTTIKNKLCLDDFIFIVQALAVEPMQRKALFCDIGKYVVLPNTADELEEFCVRCMNESVPLPDNKTLLTEQSFKTFLHDGLSSQLQNIPQFHELQKLNSLLKQILNLANVASLEEYVSLPQASSLKQLCGACESFMAAWKNAPTSFGQKIIASCEDILTIVGKIQADAFNALRQFWVFDTCALIHQPDLLRTATDNVMYIIPKVVIRELDGNKTDLGLSEDDRRNAAAAIRNIKRLQNGNQLAIEEGDLNLIAPEYQQQPTKDDWILAVAAAHKGSEVVLITDDNNLTNKAGGEGVKVIDSRKCWRLQREVR